MSVFRPAEGSALAKGDNRSGKSARWAPLFATIERQKYAEVCAKMYSDDHTSLRHLSGISLALALSLRLSLLYISVSLGHSDKKTTWNHAVWAEGYSRHTWMTAVNVQVHSAGINCGAWQLKCSSALGSSSGNLSEGLA